MTQSHNVFQGLLDLDCGISWNDAEACAGRVKKNSIEFFKHLGEFFAVVANYYSVRYAQTMQVGV